MGGCGRWLQEQIAYLFCAGEAENRASWYISVNWWELGELYHFQLWLKSLLQGLAQWLQLRASVLASGLKHLASSMQKRRWPGPWKSVWNKHKLELRHLVKCNLPSSWCNSGEYMSLQNSLERVSLRDSCTLLGFYLIWHYELLKHMAGRVGACPNILESNVSWIDTRLDPHLPILLSQPEMLVQCVIACQARCWPVALFLLVTIKTGWETELKVCSQLCCLSFLLCNWKKWNCPG